MTLDETKALELAAFVERLRLRTIECVRLEAAIDDEAPVTRVLLTVGDPLQYRLESDAFYAKYRAEVQFLGDSDKLVRHLLCEHVVSHELSTGPVVDDEVLGAYLATEGAQIAFPYIRETLDALSARLSMGQMNLQPLGTDELPLRIEFPVTNR